MELYSHRGIGLGPENSLASMREAKKRGIKFYEADVDMSADGVQVLSHNHNLVKRHSYEELQKLGIPRLEEALQEAKELELGLDLDLKQGVKGPETLAAVEKYDYAEHVLFSSFFPQKVKRIKRRSKGAKVGFITQIHLPQFMIPFLAKAGMDYIKPHTDTVTKRFVEKAHRSGLKVVSWCRSNEEINQNNQECGIDGMIVNL